MRKGTSYGEDGQHNSNKDRCDIDEPHVDGEQKAINQWRHNLDDNH